MQRVEIEKAALAHYGQDNQLLKAVEECNELASALLHFRGGRATEMDVMTEIADMAIMLDQLAMVFDADHINAEMARKLKRLEERMK